MGDKMLTRECAFDASKKPLSITSFTCIAVVTRWTGTHPWRHALASVLTLGQTYG